MDTQVLTSFARELEKLSAGGMDAFKALDRAGQMAGSGVSGATAAARNVPRVGTFGVKTVVGAPKMAAGLETMDGPSWRQTLKDAPLVIGGTALGYGVGKTLSEEIGRRIAQNVAAGAPKPAWVRHAPLVAGIASSLASYAFGRSREEGRRRREEARKRDKP